MIIIYILGFLISGLLLYKFVASPELGRYYTATNQYNSQQQREMRRVGQRDEFAEEYLALKKKTDLTKKMLFTEREAEDFFLKKLPKLSDQMGSKLMSMTPRDSYSITPKKPVDPRQKNEPVESPIEISQKAVPVTLTGKYGNMIKLFKALEANKKLMAISNVGVGATTDGDVSVRFSLDLIHVGLDIDAPPDSVLADIMAKYQTAKLVKLSEDIMLPQEIAALPQETVARSATVPRLTDEIAKPRSGWFSSIVDKFRPQESTSKQSESGKRVTKRYSVQVGVSDVESNVEELDSFLKSKNLDPWIKPGMKTATPPYYMFVGRFITKKEAYEFGKTMLRELPWVNEYEVKEVLLDYGTLPKEALAVEESPKSDQPN